MKVMIFGGAGFVGSHLVQEQLDAGHEVVVVDNYSRGHADFLPEHNRLSGIIGDIRDPQLFEAVLATAAPEVVYHLAAIHHIPTCERKPVVALATNVLGTQRVIDFCRDRQVARLIFASSGAVYDDGSGTALRETDALRGRDVYATSKLAGEALVARGVDRGWFCASVARLFNVVGAHETNAHLVPELIWQIAAGARKIELGNLHPRRDYVHVKDVARALSALGDQPGGCGYEVYNIGSGREWTVVEVVQQLAAIAGVELEIESVASKRRDSDRVSQLADVSLIAERLGWRPQSTLAQALADAWAEHQAAPQRKEAA